jgi:hypothetical protein
MQELSREQRRRRRRLACMHVASELIFTVLPHPFPGYTRTFEIQALDRTSVYQFESLIVIFMFGRIFHVWSLWKHVYFHRAFERTVYHLGHQRSVIRM